MAKRARGARPSDDDASIPRPKPAPAVGTSLRGALAGVSLTRPTPATAPPATASPTPGGAEPRTPPPRTPPVAKAAATEVPQAAATPPDALEARPSATLRGHDRFAYFEAMSGVRPLARRGPVRTGTAVVGAAPRDDAAARARDEEVRARLAALVGGGVRFDVRRDDDWIEALREGQPVAALRTLARAAAAEATLDLHGARAADVEPQLGRWLRAQHRAGARRVLVIHGKGLHSPGGPVLRDAVVAALTEGGAAPLVVALCPASAALGGTGALLVQLG